MKKLKILWPISPMDEAPQATEQIIAFLRSLKGRGDFEVQPVSVVSSAYMATAHYFEPIDTSELIKNVRAEAQKLMAKWSDLPLHPPRVLENLVSSQSAEVQIFTEFAQDYRADLIVMASNGRQGWSRAFLGSFAESLILQSQTPVMVFGPQCKSRQKLSSALLPVELNESSEKFVRHFLREPLAGLIDQIRLFHKISMVDMEDIAWAPTLYGFGGEGSQNILQKARVATEKFLKILTQIPAQGLKLQAEISESLDPVAQVLVDESKGSDTDLLIMRSDAGPIAARVLGSVVRSVVREAGVPVLVYPHKFH